MNRLLFAASLLTLLCACSDGETQVMIRTTGPAEVPDPSIDGWVPTADPANDPVPVPADSPKMGCEKGYTYEGFAGTQLEVGRDEDSVGFDRDRLKPLSALRGEYARVLGRLPPVLDVVGNTFGAVPPRWYVEPEGNAVLLFSAMRVAFAGCLDLTATTAFDSAPADDTARAQCAAFAHRFWSRAAEADELEACVEVAVKKTMPEAAPRRRWAYTCASVLSSAGFLTY